MNRSSSTSRGVCGVNLDHRLLAFAGDVLWLKAQGADIQRFNLGQQPLAFAEHAAVKFFLARSAAAALPLILVDDAPVLSGRYPARAELSRWARIRSAPEMQTAAVKRSVHGPDAER